MDENTILKLIKSNKISAVIDSDISSILQILQTIDFQNIAEENRQSALQSIIGTVTEKNKQHINAIVTTAKTISQNIDYVIPTSTITMLLEELAAQDQKTQLTILELINGADNLIAEASTIAEQATISVLETINCDDFRDDVSCAAIELLGSLTAYSLPTSFIKALEQAEIMDNAAITAAFNAPSYSSEDRAKLLHKIVENLDITSGKTHATLLMATLMLIEEDHPQLFEHFKNVSGRNKAMILRQLKDASPFLPIHESILLYSANDSDEETLKYANEILDAQGKNPHKEQCDKINNWGEFRDFVQAMIQDRRDTYKKSLSDYLSSVLFTVAAYRDQALQVRDVARILQDSFAKPPIPYNNKWCDLPEVEENTFAEVENLLKQQIVDLRQLQRDGLLENIDEEGVEAESGSHWQNTELFTYLELGTNGHEQSSSDVCRWDDLTNIFFMGSISE